MGFSYLLKNSKMMKEIKRIDPVSIGKIYGLSLAFFGLIIGGIISLTTMVAGASGAFGSGLGLMSGVFGGAAVIAVPLFYGVMGFLVGIVGGAIYNVIASMIGGIKVEFSDPDKSDELEL